jgi:hypothetical protein
MDEVKTLEEIYPSVIVGSMLNGHMPERYAKSFHAASADQF